MFKPIFVFGSNTAGRHGKGTALTALKEYGAIPGQGFGRMNGCYAIPTKTYNLKPQPLSVIKTFVGLFLKYAVENPNLRFNVTRIGCGLAGYDDKQIAPFFKGAPTNCQLPPGWRELNGRSESSTKSFVSRQRS